MSRKAVFDVDGFEKSVGEDLKAVEAQMLEGRCADFAEYKGKAGERKGIRKAMERLKEAVKKESEENNG